MYSVITVFILFLLWTIWRERQENKRLKETIHQYSQAVLETPDFLTLEEVKSENNFKYYILTVAPQFALIPDDLGLSSRAWDKIETIFSTRGEILNSTWWSKDDNKVKTTTITNPHQK